MERKGTCKEIVELTQTNCNAINAELKAITTQLFALKRNKIDQVDLEIKVLPLKKGQGATQVAKADQDQRKELK